MTQAPGPGWFRDPTGTWRPPTTPPPPAAAAYAPPPGPTKSTNGRVVLIVLASLFGFCFLGSGCLAVVAVVSPPTTTTPPMAQAVEQPAPSTTAEQITPPDPDNPFTAEAVMASFKVSGLDLPNPRDETDRVCPELGCRKATTTDILSVHEWPTTSSAVAFRSTNDSEPELVAVGKLTTVRFHTGPNVPSYERERYEAALATLTGDPAPTTTTIETTTTTTVPPTTVPTTVATTVPPPPPPTEPPTTAPPVTQPAPVYVPPVVPSVSYRNCSEAKAAGAAPIYRGQPGYAPHLDRDNDGIACET